MTDHEKLVAQCEAALRAKGLEDHAHKSRLRTELREIEVQQEAAYFLNLAGKYKAAENENNLLICNLLGICDKVDMSRDPVYEMGEFPDIDTDFIKEVQIYLKNVWAPQEFGEEFVSNIGNYGTFGLKLAITEMARVHGYDRHDIQAITTKLEGKDDEGDKLTLEKAKELYGDLREFLEQNPSVEQAAQRILNRNRNMGKHAGGLIISSMPISDLVPLVRGADGTVQTAWVEGLSGQDLQPVGLVKYDILVLTNLKQLAYIVHLVKDRHNKQYICDDGYQHRNWSDVSYLNDEMAIRMANAGDLKCVFQFDSPGIRKMVKGSVTSFDDLAAFSALWRPGPLGMKMQERYVERKAGREPYEIYPILKPVLGATYGVMVFQEQVMKILNIVGLIPLKDCEKVRKAISKKKVDMFLPYKDMFVKNGQKVLGASEEELLNLWAQIESFAEYGFNKSHSVAYTYVSSRLLYLKAHYPLEFYCGTFMCEHDTAKIKEYKLDAHRHGVEVLPIKVNISKENFSIHEGSIYYGLSNLKGVGEADAKKVVAGYPYTGLRDFLERFGTDAKICTRLILLNAFEGDRRRNFKYYEFYKSHLKKMVDRDKRHEKSKIDHHLRLRDALIKYQVFMPELENEYGFEEQFILQILQLVPPEGRSEIAKLKENYDKFIAKHEKKVADGYIPSIEDFNPENVEIDEKYELLLQQDVSASEKEFYGFQWVHDLEKSPDYKGERTFEHFRAAMADGSSKSVWAVEVKIDEVEVRQTKTGKPFYSLKVEDSVGESASITVWSEDYDRFHEEFVSGNLVSIRVHPPHPPFPSYTFDSPPRHMRHRLPPKHEDARVVVYKKGQ